MNISIIGAGRAGTALAYLLQKKGDNISAVASRSQESLNRAKKYLDSHFTHNIFEAASRGELIILSVNDDNISSVCMNLADNEAFKENSVVAHLSGALGLNVLEPAKRIGCHVGSLHPIQTLADVDGAIANLPGSYFGLTGEEHSVEVLREVISKLGGIAVEVKDEDKALYHAAACVASNYLVAMTYAAGKLYQKSTRGQSIDLSALWPLIEGTVANLKRSGPVKALTGPLSRGDIKTIEKHLTSINNKTPEWSNFYRNLGLATCQVIKERKDLSLEKIEQLEEILRKEI